MKQLFIMLCFLFPITAFSQRLTYKDFESIIKSQSMPNFPNLETDSTILSLGFSFHAHTVPYSLKESYTLLVASDIYHNKNTDEWLELIYDSPVRSVDPNRFEMMYYANSKEAIKNFIVALPTRDYKYSRRSKTYYNQSNNFGIYQKKETFQGRPMYALHFVCSISKKDSINKTVQVSPTGDYRNASGEELANILKSDTSQSTVIVEEHIIGKKMINPDSILVENIVRFSKTQSGKAETRIDFTLKVTNLGSKPIPDLGVTNRMEQVHFFINEKEVYLPGLGNGREAIAGDKTIKQGSSQTFTQGWGLSAGNGLQKTYGDLFTVQWTYNGIKSPLVKVDLYNQKAVMVHPKIEVCTVDSTVLKRPVNYSETKTVGALLDWLNNWDKMEMDAYYNRGAYPNYIVSGETNALIASCTNNLAGMGLDIDWDTDRLMYKIKPNTPVISETTERLKRDLWKALATNKYLDLKGFDTLKFFIGDSLVQTVKIAALSSLNFEALEKEDTASIRKKIVQQTLPNLMKQYSFMYTSDSMIVMHSVEANFTIITKTIYNAKGFLLSEEKWTEGPDAFGRRELIENSFYNNNKVYRIRTITKHSKSEKEITETIDVDYVENMVLVKSKNGMIRAVMSKKKQRI